MSKTPSDGVSTRRLRVFFPQVMGDIDWYAPRAALFRRLRPSWPPGGSLGPPWGRKFAIVLFLQQADTHACTSYRRRLPPSAAAECAQHCKSAAAHAVSPQQACLTIWQNQALLQQAQAHAAPPPQKLIFFQQVMGESVQNGLGPSTPPSPRERRLLRRPLFSPSNGR